MLELACEMYSSASRVLTTFLCLRVLQGLASGAAEGSGLVRKTVDALRMDQYGMWNAFGNQEVVAGIIRASADYKHGV